MNWLRYLLEANLYLSIFYVLYVVLLATQTYHKLNRIYLLATCCISWIIPLVQFGFLIKPLNTNPNLSATGVINLTVAKAASPVTQHVQSISPQDLLIYLYFAGVFAAFLIFIFKLYGIVKLTRRTHIIHTNGYSLIPLNNSNTAFSFFKYVFIGDRLAGEEIVLKHELAHVKQKHSLDIIFTELIKILCWFNPFIYLLQRSLKALHEYIADEDTASLQKDNLSYSSYLLGNAYGLNGPAITHSFFNCNILKKRIIMLNKTRSGTLARLNYLFIVPVLAGMLCTSTLAFSKSYGWINVAPGKPESASVNKILKGDSVYRTVDVAPDFAGGTDELMKFMRKNLRYPEQARAKKLEGRVIISFVVEKNGSLDDIKLSKSLSPDLDKEALRVVGMMPKWKPGKQGGKLVRTAYAIPINFKLSPQ